MYIHSGNMLLRGIQKFPATPSPINHVDSNINHVKVHIIGIIYRKTPNNLNAQGHLQAL